MPPPEPTDENLEAPDALVATLRDLRRERVLVPAAVDAAILRRARRRLARRPPVRWLAAAAGLMLAGWLGWVQFGQRSRPDRMDINRDGRVDMVDALAVARRAGAGNAPATWDVNHDGIVDRRDAEMIARQAVKLSNRGA